MILEQELKRIPVESVIPNPEQPRKDFDQCDINDMAQSIREHGVIKPIAVEVVDILGDEKYVLHDGERRLRSAKVAGLTHIPAIVSPCIDGNAAYERLVRALVANIHAVAMNPVDDALAIRRMRDEYKLSNRQISIRIGKVETVVSTRLKLADLEEEILDLMRNKKLSTEYKAVTAFLSVKDSAARVALARRLADRHANAKMVVQACREFNGMTVAAKNVQDETKRLLGNAVRANKKNSIPVYRTPAVESVDAIHNTVENEWNALFQIGRVPPFSTVNNVVMRTCDSCSLRPMASESMCGGCALVSFLRGMMAEVKNA